jgi:diguanylate cyclase (GGDEF)-like protein/PAS domain S-box-containing protein
MRILAVTITPNSAPPIWQGALKHGRETFIEHLSLDELRPALERNVVDTVILVHGLNAEGYGRLCAVVKECGPDVPIVAVWPSSTLNTSPELLGSDIEFLVVGGDDALDRAIHRAVRIIDDRRDTARLRDELRQLRNHAGIIVDASPMLIVTLGRSGLVRTWNHAAEQILGWEADEVVGRPPPPGLAEWNLDDLHLTPPEKPSEFRCTRRDGTRVHLVGCLVPLKGAAGEIDGVAGMAIDISDRKHIESALRDSEERYRTVFHAAPIGMSITSTDTTILAANEAFASFTGRSIDELRTLRTIDITHPEDRQDSEHRFEALVNGESDSYASVKRYLRPDGTVVWGLRTVAALRDEEGVFRFAVAMIEDVTAHRQGARRLQESEEQFRTLVEASPDAIFLTDLDMCIRRANKRAAELYRVDSPAALEGLSAITMCSPADRPILMHAGAQRLAGTGTDGPMELRFQRADGSESSVEISADLVHNSSGEPTGFVAVVRDISARKEQQEALRRSQATLQVRAHQSAAVAEFGRRALATSNLATMMTDAVSLVADLLGTQRAAVLRVTAEPRHLATVAAVGWEDAPPSLRVPSLDPRSHIGYSFLTDTATVVIDYATDTRFDWHPDLRSMGIHSSLSVPIHLDGSVCGVMVAHGDDPTPFSEENLHVVQMVAHIVSAALERHAADERVRFQAHLLDVIEDAAIFFRLDGTITYCNRFAQQLYGYNEGELLGAHVDILGTPETLAEFAEIRRQLRAGESWSGELRLRRKDGTVFPAFVTDTPLFADDGTLTGIIGIGVDITARKQYEDELRRLALRDSLTDLANRVLFSDRLDHAISAAHRDGETLAVLLIDLDRFKEVNDALGHDVGDALLRQVAVRFKDSVRVSDTVARLGGDEFAVLLPDCEEDGAIRAAAALVSSLAAPIHVAPHTLLAPCSIGIALFPQHGDDAATLVRHADVAMYAAKRTGLDFGLYTPEVDPHSRERLALTSGLQAAIDSEQLYLHYQPKVALRDHCADHVEALVRWRHPELGSIAPDDFIDIAEQTGLIRPLTFWVLNEAVRQCHRWSQCGLDINVAVNLSAWNLQDAHLVSSVSQSLRTWGVRPGQLTLEITESALMVEPARALETVTALHDLGVQVSVDDFGTGYSSLSYLQRLPVDEIKIDRSFVGNLPTEDTGSAIIVRSVIDLGHNLGLQVVAEGVESAADMDLLTAMGCDLAQGYHFSRPLPPEEFVHWYRTWHNLLAIPVDPESPTIEISAS